MKTIGLIGGMSWESSAEYYRVVNETAKEKLGGLHSAQVILYSVDFAEVERLQREDRWDESAQMMADAAQSLERAGADFVVLCTNTMHKLADEIQSAIHIPFLHIADATAEKVKEAGIKRIGLLGTRYTMEHDFYKGRLIEKYGLEVIIPAEADRTTVHDVIYDELCLGIIKAESHERYIRIMEQMIQAGAEGIILGCTEIEALVHDGDVPAPLFPTAKFHAVAAVEFALK
jgi:aspartate racemase